MKINSIATITGGQDGAIFGDYLFRFEHNGDARVYELAAINKAGGEKIAPVSLFKLDKYELICPHSNSTAFGSEYYEEGDEFPLLYSNIYNNYAKAEDPLKGVCCVYRIYRENKNENEFKSQLVQLIEIGFVEDASLWKMSEDKNSQRPYGNFTVDAEKNIYYGFVMREEAEGTRYFAFDLPHGRDGEADERFGVKKVVLNKEDIKEYFDTEHHLFVQGACCHKGKIYSLEGFTNSVNNPPAIRIIDLEQKKQVFYVRCEDFGCVIEPELIDFSGDVCYYADVRGNLYTVDFN